MSVTLAGVVASYLESHPGDVPLEDLVTAVNAAGLGRSLEQVYAGVQSMASTGKCGRGHGKRTYCRLSDTDPNRVVTVAREPGAKRTAKASGIIYSNETVLTAITEVLGLPGTQAQYEKTFAVLLLGVDSPEFILERAEIVLKRKPTKWATWMQGKNVMIGFTVENVDET